MCGWAKRAWEATGNRCCLPAARGPEATVLLKRDHPGDSADAMTLFSRAEDLWRELGDKQAVAQLLINHATIMARNDPARGLELLADQERILRELGDQDALSSCLGNQGRILTKL